MVHVFGIRHHGPGSTKNLEVALNHLQPDYLLVEGPPDANQAIPYIANSRLIPPVALLVYNPSNLKQAAYYPFASFSPEWQALRYGLRADIPTEFMDLPRGHAFTLEASKELPLLRIDKEKGSYIKDPFKEIANLAGYEDSERWWEVTFERLQQPIAIFDAILELMTALREAAAPSSIQELRREAYMRTVIRTTVKKGYKKIAVVCGAWHAPVLAQWQDYTAKNDKQLLKGIKKTKTKATWIPWTYKRLALQSGYAAGVLSPAWYQLLYEKPDEVVIQWMTTVAHLLRKENLEVSSAHVIEAVRLAETLATIRSLAIPGIHELSEAAITTFGNGYALPLELVEKKLIIGERMGEVPDGIPVIPLQQDLQKCIKSARLAKDQQALEPVYKELDLRKAANLKASHLLYRLQILKINWGLRLEDSKYSLGSFKENWLLEWNPDFAIRVIEVGMWGNTVYEAAINYALSIKNKQLQLVELTQLIEKVLLADLQEVLEGFFEQLSNLSALTKDIFNLMDALSPLVNIVRYGSARNFNTSVVLVAIQSIIPRICISLPTSASNLDEAATKEVFQRILAVNRAIHILNNAKHIDNWYLTLAQIMNSGQGVLAGLCSRILLDKQYISPQIIATKMSIALSKGNAPMESAKWIEGFLSGSGLLLIYNEQLWEIVDEWIDDLQEERFTEILPVLRRTFSKFSNSEKQKVFSLVKNGRRANKNRKKDQLSEERVAIVVPTIEKILGLDLKKK